MLPDSFSWNRLVLVCFYAAKPRQNFIKFYRMKVDILSFNLIGNISYLDQYIESYHFSKFDPDSGMNSVVDWL